MIALLTRIGLLHKRIPPSSKKGKFFRFLRLALEWYVGLYYLLPGLFGGMTPEIINPRLQMASLLLAVIMVPPTNMLMAKKWNVEIKGIAKVFIFFAAGFLFRWYLY